MMATINNTVMLMVASAVCVPDVRSGVYSGVSRRTLWNTGSVVDDVFIAACLPVRVQFLSLLALVVEFLNGEARLKVYKSCMFKCMSQL